MPKFKGEKLDDLNHYNWSFAFLSYARTKETDGIFLGTDVCPTTGPNSRPVKAWDKRAAMAAADLIAAVDHTQFVHLRGIEQNPRAMWETLELVHQTGEATNDSLSTWNEFFAAQYTDFSLPLKTHIGRILEIANRLSDLFSDPPSEQQIIARILSSLPHEFDRVVTYLSDTPYITDRAFVVARILKEEGTLRRGGGLVVTNPSQANALATTVEPVVCSNCKRRGHSLEQCFHKGGPLEGNIPDWFLKRHEPQEKPQTLYAATFAL